MNYWACTLIMILSFGVPQVATAQAAAPLTKVVMTIGAISEREGVVYVAQD